MSLVKFTNLNGSCRVNPAACFLIGSIISGDHTMSWYGELLITRIERSGIPYLYTLGRPQGQGSVELNGRILMKVVALIIPLCFSGRIVLHARRYIVFLSLISGKLGIITD